MKPTGATKEWEYIEVGHGAHVRIGKFRISAHWQGLADSEEIRSIMRQIADGHNERERLREGLRLVRAMFFEHAESGGYTEKGKLVKLDNEQHPWIPGVEAPRAIAIIDAALNEVEG